MDSLFISYSYIGFKAQAGYKVALRYLEIEPDSFNIALHLGIDKSAIFVA